MKYISVKDLGNEIYVFDKEDALCDKCSYPLDHRRKGCNSCNIFFKNSQITGGVQYFDKIFSVGKYFQMKKSEKPTKRSKDIMTWLIYSYKKDEKYVPFCVELLGTNIMKFISSSSISSKDILICPVPDYEDREYKKADLLAEEISKKLNLEFCLLLEKTKSIPQQHRLKTLKEKFDNVKEVFKINNNYLKLIEGKTIILVDDVVSSTASINECSKVLKEAGAEKVYVFSLGRNILPEKEKEK